MKCISSHSMYELSSQSAASDKYFTTQLHPCWMLIAWGVLPSSSTCRNQPPSLLSLCMLQGSKLCHNQVYMGCWKEYFYEAKNVSLQSLQFRHSHEVLNPATMSQNITNNVSYIYIGSRLWTFEIYTYNSSTDNLLDITQFAILQNGQSKSPHTFLHTIYLSSRLFRSSCVLFGDAYQG